MYYITPDLEVVKGDFVSQDETHTTFKSEDTAVHSPEMMTTIESKITTLYKIENERVFKSKKKAEASIPHFVAQATLHGVAMNNNEIENLNNKVEELRKMTQSKADTTRISLDKVKQTVERGRDANYINFSSLKERMETTPLGFFLVTLVTFTCVHYITSLIF